ncbi:hypothetical protein B0H16DRAFT_1729643 [Mycena metata]|uniref:Uncharacterized protein n=1 Tax=Mycena metata TaxID=1033252 RepID=A0AAD7ICV8_9AGAR|nr:hypothetical protein B0H16DRAFT_1729643 [Mycena metata]
MSVSTALPSPNLNRRATTSTPGTPPGPNTHVVDQVHPRFHTGIKRWRFLNTVVFLGFGVAKAIVTYRAGGQPTAPTTLDWIIGVVWALMCAPSPAHSRAATIKTRESSYWVGVFEADNAPVVSRRSHELRVMITPWRCMNTTVFATLGIYKAVTSYRGQTSVPTALEWTVGVGWTLISYWIEILQDDEPSLAVTSWFFGYDFLGTKTRYLDLLVAGKFHVDITPWRMLNTAVVLALGTYKASAAFCGQTTAPNTLDWITGIVWTLISFWIDVLEKYNTSTAGKQWFLSHDLTDALSFMLLVAFGITMMTLIIMSIYSFASQIPMMVRVTSQVFRILPQPHIPDGFVWPPPANI